MPEEAESEKEIVYRLVDKQHLSVADRLKLPRGRASFDLVVAALIKIVNESGSYPRNLRPQDDYHGGILAPTNSGRVEIHWRAESGVVRFATIKVEVFATLEEAARVYVEKEWPSGIDGVAIEKLR